MDTYWVPGVNHLGTDGRWAFAEFTEVYQIESDFSTRVESDFLKMMELVSGRDPYSLEGLIGRSHAYISSQFGSDPALVRLNENIWTSINSSDRRSFRLSDLGADVSSEDMEHALAILALLSDPAIRLLRIQFRSQSDGGNVISSEEVTRTLTEWWRKKQISEQDWRLYASSIAVSWIPTDSEEPSR